MDFSHFDPAVFARRREKLAARMGGTVALIPAGAPPSRNYPALTYPFRPTSHFLYFVGLPFTDGMLLLEGGKATLFLPPPAPDDAMWHGALPSFAELAERTGMRIESLAGLRSRLAGKTVTTVAAIDPATLARQRELVDRAIPGDEDLLLIDAIIELRLRHDEAAKEAIGRATVATTAAHRSGMTTTRAGMHEYEVKAAMEAELTRRGMTTSFNTIATVHGEVLHNEVYHHTLQDGDLFLADLGAETSDGWAGDVTRTWPVSGRFSSSQRDFYDLVLAAEKAAIARVAPGVRYRDIHLEAARVIASGLVDLGVFRGDVDELVADGVHALLFPHGIGHLLGLDAHDMEDLGDRAGYAPGRTRSEQFGLSYLRLDRDLEPDMVVTIEPGIYQVKAILENPQLLKKVGDRFNRERLAAFADVRGIRIEDDVLVTADGHRVLTDRVAKEPKELEELIAVSARNR